ncbi:hypothetical protein MHBO_005188, partial [Bonamia ostreae]
NIILTDCNRTQFSQKLFVIMENRFLDRRNTVNPVVVLDEPSKETSFNHLINPLNAVSELDQKPILHHFSDNRNTLNQTVSPEEQNNFKQKIRSALTNNKIKIESEETINIYYNAINDKIVKAVEKIIFYSKRRLDQLKDYQNS